MEEIQLSKALEKYDLATKPSRYKVFLPKYGTINLVTITEAKIKHLISIGCTYFVPKKVEKKEEVADKKPRS